MSGRLVVDTIEGSSSSGNMISVTPGHHLIAPGHVLQCQYKQVGPARFTSTSITPVAVTDLLIAFTPKKATSRIVIQCQINTNAGYVTTWGIYKDGAATVSTSGYTNSSAANMNSTVYIGTTTIGEYWSVPLQYSELAASTTVRTYQLYVGVGWPGTGSTVYINNRDANDMAGFSTMTIWEIAQ
jgi:hypothetical protein